MNITVMITLGGDEVAPMNSTEAATAVLGALGADPEKDICTVNMSQTGTAGSTPTIPAPAPPTS